MQRDVYILFLSVRTSLGQISVEIEWFNFVFYIHQYQYVYMQCFEKQKNITPNVPKEKNNWLNSQKVCTSQIIFCADVAERQNCTEINTYCQSVGECNGTAKKKKEYNVFSANFAPRLRFVPRLRQPNLAAVQPYSFFLHCSMIGTRRIKQKFFLSSQFEQTQPA